MLQLTMTQKLGLLLSLLFVALARPDRIARLAPGQSGEQRPPNLIVVMTDEHNFRTLGCYRRLLAVEQAQMWGPVVVESRLVDVTTISSISAAAAVPPAKLAKSMVEMTSPILRAPFARECTISCDTP